MITINKLNLKSQWIYRLEPPKGQYFVDFKLDPKSEYELVEEARKLNSKDEIKNFQDGIEEAACLAVLKMPKEEIASGQINEYMRLQVDPKYTGRMFAFQVKRIGEKNELAITKAEVLPVEEGQELTKNSDLQRDLELSDQHISTNLYTKPIHISYNLDEKSLSHLSELISSFTSEDEITEMEQQIRKAVRIAAHKMVDNGAMYKPGGSRLKWKFKDEENGKELRFLFTVINGTRFVVNKIRIKNLFEVY